MANLGNEPMGGPIVECLDATPILTRCVANRRRGGDADGARGFLRGGSDAGGILVLVIVHLFELVESLVLDRVSYFFLGPVTSCHWPLITAGCPKCSR